MHTVIPRTQPQPNRAPPRKSSSYVSLRRDKDKNSPNIDPYSSNETQPSYYSSSRPTYFDAYPSATPGSSRPTKQSRVREARSSCPTSFEDTVPSERGPATSNSSHYLSFPSTEDVDGPVSTPKPFPRERSRTGPSIKSSHWIDPNPSPRISITSTLTGETITPPDTPVDNVSVKDFDVLVAAPVFGVEMMDALVDGMNGGEEIISNSSRNRYGIPNHHPLYQPPLPTPPPGVVLGGGKARRRKKAPKALRRSSYSDDGDEEEEVPVTARPRRTRPPPSPTRSVSSSTVTNHKSPSSLASPKSIETDVPPTARPQTAPPSPSSSEKRKSLAPSISDIIRAYAPPETHLRTKAFLTRTPSHSRSVGHETVHEESEPEPESLPLDGEGDLLSRSSIDSIADEVRRTLRHQNSMKQVAPPPSSFSNRHSMISDTASVLSPRSDGGGAASIYSSSIASSQPPLSPFDTSFMANMMKNTPSQAVAQYLRSARLTTLLKLSRSPHASHDNPLTVSLSDLGSPSGFPVVVFLGLGGVRHVMGLYDEMAELLGLRLITIDRWGLGRTEPRSKSAKGIIQWASVVEEVLDLLHIDQCSVMAHSAGAPYALSFANKLKHRIRGDVCLLAPWVSESSGYKWLKYVPNGILKTAQAAEWKLQTWTIGKPPSMPWEGIGYDAKSTQRKTSDQRGGGVYPSLVEGHPRPSTTSSAFSAYDDLQDFDGRFESRSTLGNSHTSQYGSRSESKIQITRKTSRGFLGRLKSQPQSPSEETPSTGKRLKALRSMGSLKSKSSSAKKSPAPTSPQLPPALKVDVGLGLDDLTFGKSFDSSSMLNDRSRTSTPENPPTTSRSNGQRSMSLSSPGRPTLSLPPSPNPPFHESSSDLPSPNNAYQAALGNALIAASHSESAKGTHNDLLQILNHDNHPWGFSYETYPHKVQVWYGDRDEKIADNAVRWMEKTMGEGKCSVKVVKGADHGLLYKSGVVVDLLESLLGFWT